MTGKTIVIPLFAALLVVSALFSAGTAGAQAAQGVDPSSYRLIGTIMADGFLGAVLVDSKGEQTLYRLHDHLPDGSQVTKVESDSIIVMRSDGTLYEIFIAHDTKTAVPQTVAPSSSTVQVVPETAPAPDRTSREKLKRKSRGRRPSSVEE